MKKYRYCLVIILLYICSVLSYSQDTNVYSQIRSDLDYLFSDLDKSRIPSGYLKENAVELVNLSLYNGNQDNAISVDLSTFENIINTLKSSSVRTTPLTSVSATDIIEDMLENTSSSYVPVGILAYKYNTFKENALEDGFILYSDGQVSDAYDSNGNWKNPYTESLVLAFSPSRSIFNAGPVTLNFSEFLYTNLSISSIELDYGAGYIQVNESINVTLNSSYNEFKVRITLDDGSVLYSVSDIYVQDVLMNPQDIDTDITMYFSDSAPLTGYTSEAYVHIDLIDGNTSLTKPFIVVDGFDPTDIAEIFDIDDMEYGFCNIDTFRETLSSEIANNYDIVYVDWMNSESYIQANADRLIEIIQWINEQKSTDEKNVLYGHSMGGLIARYALRTMETEHIPHEVTTYISHDSPHLGVNLPIGLQYALYDIMNDMNMASIIPYADILTKYLYAPSVKQMLIHHVGENGQINNNEHDSWLTELANIGFPQGDDLNSPIRNIAISNGGNYSVSPVLASASGGLLMQKYGILLVFGTYLSEWFIDSQLFDVPSFLPFIFSGNVNLDADVQILPFKSSGCLVYDADITMTKHVRFINWSKTYSLRSVSKYAPSGIALDNVFGSYYSLSSISSELPEYEEDSSLYSADFSMSMADNILFVPSVSSLCIGSHNTNLTYNDYHTVYTNSDNTPFDDVYITPSASAHTMSLGESMCDWISDNLLASLSGPVCGVNGSVYEMHNVSGLVEWSTSDSDIATISSAGILNVISSGQVTIYADVDFGTHESHFEKRIITGLPLFTLSSQRAYLHGAYSVSATCSATNLTYFWDLTNTSYQWGIKEGTGAIVWSEPITDYGIFDREANTMSITKIVDASKSSKQVYFKISNDAYSATYNISCPMLPTPVPIDPPIYIIPDGTLVVGEENIEVKSASSDDMKCIIQVYDKYDITFDHIPSAKDLIHKLVEIDTFKEEIYNMKPWGTKDFMILKVEITYIDNSGKETKDTQILKFLYKEKL